MEFRSTLKCAVFAALVVLVGAVPARAVPYHDVFIMLDNSGSLGAADFAAQRQAAIDLVQDYGGNPNNPMRFSIIDFATTATLIHSLEDDPLNPGGPQDHSAVLTTLNALTFTGGWTDTPGALQLMLDEQALYGSDENTSTAILFTDGQPYGPSGPLNVCGYENTIKSRGISVKVVGHGNGWSDEGGPEKVGCLVELESDILSKPAPLEYDINDYAYLSATTLIAMPEPGTLAVLGMGLAVIGFARRRTA